MHETASRRSSGLALHGSTVALTPARAVTSHLRRHYVKHYHGRFRFAPWVFVFDLSLLGIVFVLVFLNIWFRVVPPPAPAGLHLIFSAPPLTAGAPQALEAQVTASGDRSRGHVVLTWDLPPNTEILSAIPPLSTDHQADLGTLSPGQASLSHIVVRLFTTVGTPQRIGFRVRDDTGYYLGSEERAIASSALTFERLSPRVDFVTSQALLPYLLKNTTSLPLDAIEIDVDSGATIEGQSRLFMPGLGPYEQRLVWVRPVASGSASALSLFHVQALSRGAVLVRQTETFTVGHPQPDGGFSLSLSPSTPGQPTTVHGQANRPVTLMVYHPLLQQTETDTRFFDVATGTIDIVLPLKAGDTPATRWFVIPLWSVIDRDGGTSQIVMGDVVSSAITTLFPVTASARYYAATGDQLGIGPLPPRVGQETKYWISWKLGPTSADLSNVDLRASLPAGVRLTGRYALPDGGALSQQAESVVWHLPFLPTVSQEVTASFEVALTPSASMRGKEAELLSATQAQAQENRSGVTLHAVWDPLTSALPEDERAQGKSVVR